MVPGRVLCPQLQGECLDQDQVYAQVEAQTGHRDAESRAAAVRALSAVAHELFAVSVRPRATSGSADLGPEVLEASVIRPLLEAAQDYCTDDRYCHLHPSQCVRKDSCTVLCRHSSGPGAGYPFVACRAFKHCCALGVSEYILDHETASLVAGTLRQHIAGSVITVLFAGVMWVAGSEKQPS